MISQPSSPLCGLSELLLSPAPQHRPALPAASPPLRFSELLSSRPQVLDQVVELVFGQVVGPAMLVLRIEDCPYLFQRGRGSVMKIRRSDGDVGQLWCIEQTRVVGHFLGSHVEDVLI